MNVLIFKTPQKVVTKWLPFGYQMATFCIPGAFRFAKKIRLDYAVIREDGTQWKKGCNFGRGF